MRCKVILHISLYLPLLSYIRLPQVVQLLIEARGDPRIKCAARGCTALDLVKGPASRGIRSAVRVRQTYFPVQAALV